MNYVNLRHKGRQRRWHESDNQEILAAQTPMSFVLAGCVVLVLLLSLGI